MYAQPVTHWQTADRRGGAILCALAGVALLLQLWWLPVNADVSWLLTLGEQLLAGKRLYIDLLEPNPPASVWLYLPWIWIALKLGIRPEAMVIGATLAAALISGIATLRLAARLPRPPSPSLMALVLGAVTLILPGALMAQREHVALLLALPALTAIALIAGRRSLPPTTTLVTGIAAGLAIVIKPHFALVFLFPATWAALQSRGVGRLLLPGLAAAAVALAYAAAVIALTPAYLDLLPMFAQTYVPMRDKPLNFLIGPMLVIPFALAVLAQILRAEPRHRLATALFLGAAGFALAGLIQGKNYLNHALPGMALAFAAIALLLAEPCDRRRRRLVATAAAVLAAMQLHATFSIQPKPGLAEAILRVSPPHPTMTALSADLTTGHPAARHVGARWVGSGPSLFTAAGARYVGLDQPGMRAFHDADIAAFVADVRRARPDIILVDDRSRPWLMREPPVRAVMAGYAPATRAGSIEVWRRR